MTTYDKEEGDTDGPFDVAAATSKGEAHMVWFASAQFATDNVNAMVSGANADLLVNAINWMAQQEDNDRAVRVAGRKRVEPRFL